MRKKSTKKARTGLALTGISEVGDKQEEVDGIEDEANKESSAGDGTLMNVSLLNFVIQSQKALRQACPGSWTGMTSLCFTRVAKKLQKPLLMFRMQLEKPPSVSLLAVEVLSSSWVQVVMTKKMTRKIILRNTKRVKVTDGVREEVIPKRIRSSWRCEEGRGLNSRCPTTSSTKQTRRI